MLRCRVGRIGFKEAKEERRRGEDFRFGQRTPARKALAHQ
jgi:hypothetical protein